MISKASSSLEMHLHSYRVVLVWLLYLFGLPGAWLRRPGPCTKLCWPACWRIRHLTQAIPLIYLSCSQPCCRETEKETE